MYGLSIYNLIAVRAEPSDKSENVTQLLFGDAYQVLKKSDNGNWLYITTPEDGYEGWIDTKLHASISEKLFQQWLSEAPQYSGDIVNFIYKENFSHPIFFGSRLPFLQNNYISFDNTSFKYEGKNYSPKGNSMTEKILNTAYLFLNTPYLWGGKSHAGIDCSGLMQQIFRVNGHKLKRDAWQQEMMGAKVTHLDKAESGDLAFFCNQSGRVIHVGILTQPNKILHAHGRVRVDSLDSKGILNTETNTYSHQLYSIKRYITSHTEEDKAEGGQRQAIVT